MYIAGFPKFIKWKKKTQTRDLFVLLPLDSVLVCGKVLPVSAPTWPSLLPAVPYRRVIVPIVSENRNTLIKAQIHPITWHLQ